jgi:hypothetical protein
MQYNSSRSLIHFDVVIEISYYELNFIKMKSKKDE